MAGINALLLSLLALSAFALPRDDFFWGCTVGVSTYYCLNRSAYNVTTLIPGYMSSVQQVWPVLNNGTLHGVTLMIEGLADYQPAFWYMTFTAPMGKPFHEGLYLNATNLGALSQPYINYQEGATSCTTLGSFKVSEVRLNANKTALESLAVDFNQTCAYTTGFDHIGKVRVNSVYDYCGRPEGHWNKHSSLFCYHSQEGEPVGKGESHSYALPAKNFTIYPGTTQTNIYLTVDNFQDNWFFTLATRQGDTFQPYTIYDHASNYPNQSVLQPGLSFQSLSLCSQQTWSRFNMLAIEKDSSGKLLKYEFTAEQRCGSADGPGIFAYVKYIADSEVTSS